MAEIENDDHHVSEEELLIEAARRGNEDLLTTVINRGEVNVNHIDGLGNSALHYAAGGGHSACLVTILDIGGDSMVSWPNFKGETPLHRAALSDDLESAKVLLAAGACAMDRTTEGKSPIDLVVSPEMGALLLPYVQADRGTLAALKGLVADSDSDDEEES